MMHYSKLYISFVVAAIMFVNGTSAPTNEGQNKSRRSNRCDCICGNNYRQMRVVGGSEAKPHEFPWIAGLNKNGKFQCGASLISQKHILTAAHCVNGLDITDLSVVLADHNRAAPNRLSNIIVRGLRTIKQHEQFDNNTFNNDIAVLELDQPVDFTSTVQPGCLPHKDVDLSGRDGVVIGWGWTSENDRTSTVLRKVTVPIWTKEECWNSHYGQKRISDNMFCAGFSDGKQDACRGDSGGPIHMSSLNNEVMEIIEPILPDKKLFPRYSQKERIAFYNLLYCFGAELKDCRYSGTPDSRDSSVTLSLAVRFGLYDHFVIPLAKTTL